jgi:hypothetical protein
MQTLRKVQTLIIATAVIWLSVLVVSLLISAEFIQGAAAILALVGTVTIWSMWALSEYGLNIEGAPLEKPKRESEATEDPRLALLLSLLTPDQRDALQARLLDDLSADGENVSLAELLAEQEQDSVRAGRAPGNR